MYLLPSDAHIPRAGGVLTSHPTQIMAFFTQIGLVPVEAGCTHRPGISIGILDPCSSASASAPSPAPHHTALGGAIWGGGEQKWGGVREWGRGCARLRVYAFYFSNSFILFSHPEQYERSSK